MYVHSGLKLCSPGWTQINSTATTARVLGVQMCAIGVDIKGWGLNFFKKRRRRQKYPYFFTYFYTHILYKLYQF